jgi:hypothetical protein
VKSAAEQGTSVDLSPTLTSDREWHATSLQMTDILLHAMNCDAHVGSHAQAMNWVTCHPSSRTHTSSRLP